MLTFRWNKKKDEYLKIPCAFDVMGQDSGLCLRYARTDIQLEFSSCNHLFRCVRISMRGLVLRSVGWLVGWSVMLSLKLMKNRLLRTLNDLDSAGRGGRRDEEEAGTRRKEGQGGRRDEEEGWTRRKDGRGGRSDMEKEAMRVKMSVGLVFALNG